ncbi:hypothetical protein K0U07_00555 [bacterium]|nr:hypothetical protein [bacterium]
MDMQINHQNGPRTPERAQDNNHHAQQWAPERKDVRAVALRAMYQGQPTPSVVKRLNFVIAQDQA